MGSVVKAFTNPLGSVLGQAGELADSLDLTGARARSAALGAQGDAYGDVRAYYQPYQQAGGQALSRLTSGNFQMDPGYQFRMDEGLKALQNAAGARGGRQSGATLKALTGYGQNLASQEYGNAFNRNLSLANMGYGAAQNLAGAATGYGNARASNAIGDYNSKMNLLGQGVQFGALALGGGFGGFGGFGGAETPMANSSSFNALPQSPSANFLGIQPTKLNTYGY